MSYVMSYVLCWFYIIGVQNSFLWPPCVADADIIFLPCGSFFYLSSIFFYSLPNLSGCRLDVYHTSTHGVALAVLLRPSKFHRHRGGWLPQNQHRHRGVLQCSRRSFWALFTAPQYSAVQRAAIVI